MKRQGWWGCYFKLLKNFLKKTVAFNIWAVYNTIAHFGKGVCKSTLTTAQQKKIEKNIEQIKFKKKNKRVIRRIIQFKKVLSKEKRKPRISTKYDQAKKSVWWMPWHQTPMKDAISCEKPRGAASRQQSVGVRMWKHTRDNALVLIHKYIVY